MTVSALKENLTGAGKAVATTPRPHPIVALLEAQKTSIQQALPKHMDPDRLLRIAFTELRKTPKLKQCEPASFVGAVIQCAQLGLEPGNALGHAYLIPYGKECQFMLGYRGMIDLARRSGQIVSLTARAVYADDEFRYRFGLDDDLHHVPNVEVEPEAKALTFVYAVAKLKDGGVQFDVMSRSEVDAVRKRSRAGNSGPWVTDYVAMALKTVTRRLFKWLPVSIEVQRAIGMDEAGDRGEQVNAAIIDGQFAHIGHDGGDEPEVDEGAGAEGGEQQGADAA